MPTFAEKLSSSGLTLADAKKLGVVLLPPSDKTLRSALPRTCKPISAIQFRYHTTTGVLRRDIFRARLLGEAHLEEYNAVWCYGDKPVRYLQLTDTAPAAYFPKSEPWEKIAKDPTIATALTEGELKAACACKSGIPTIGLGGVWNWKSSKLSWSLLPELRDFTWTGRDVVICFDSDAKTNPGISMASAQISRALSNLGALPRIAALPALPKFGDKKTGLDDFVVECGAAAFLEVLEEATGGELTAELWRMNAEYVLLTAPDVLYEEAHGTQLNPRKALSTTLANRITTIMTGTEKKPKLEEVPVLRKWLSWPHRRDLRAFTYAPGKPRVVSDEYNLWPGWGCEPKAGDLGPYHSLLDHIFQKDDVAREWYLNWLAYPVQNPGAKMATAVMLWSLDQGAGKSLSAMMLRYVYGTENYSAINQVAFEGGFNDWGANKQFVLVDDVSSVTRKDARDNAAVLKTRITQEFLTVNIKFVAHYRLPDTINYFLTSNRHDALYLDEKDRRFFVHEIRGGKLPHKERVRFVKWRDGTGPVKGGRGVGPAALHRFLLDKKLGGFDEYTEPPVSESKKKMIHAAHTDAEAWCVAMRAEPDSFLKLDKVPLKRDLYTSTQLMDMFVRQTGVNHTTPQSMGQALAGVGFERRVVSVGGSSQGLYAIRNTEVWADTTPIKWAEHFKKTGGV